MPNSATSMPVALITAKDARLLGKRPYQDRALTLVRPGVYAPAATWGLLTPWDRYVARVRAAAAVFDDATMCLESAAALLRLPLFGEPRDIHLLAVGGKSRRYGDVVIHSTQDEREFVVIDGIAVTTLVDTVIDLTRFLPPAFALAVADTGLRRSEAEGRAIDLTEAAAGLAAARGCRQFRWVAERATSAAESPGESVSRAAIEWLGYEAPELQVTFDYEGAEDRSDFYWRRRRTLGESDGYGKYDAADVAAAKVHFIAEKRREDRLRRHEDGFVRWDWSDTMRVEPLDAKLHAAGLRPVRARQAAMIDTLRHNPRSFEPSELRGVRRPGPSETGRVH